MAALDPRDEVRRLTNELDQVAATYATNGDDNARRHLRKLALELAQSLESPVDSHDKTLFEVNAHDLVIVGLRR